MSTSRHRVKDLVYAFRSAIDAASRGGRGSCSLANRDLSFAGEELTRIAPGLSRGTLSRLQRVHVRAAAHVSDRCAPSDGPPTRGYSERRPGRGVWYRED